MKYYWHLHHNILLEPLTEPLKNRIKYIKREKPADEIGLRLKLLKKVKGKIPAGIIKAWDIYNEALVAYNEALVAYNEALVAYEKAWVARYEARDAYIKAEVAYRKAISTSRAIRALHKKECGCGYSFTKQTIFTKKNGLEKD